MTPIHCVYNTDFKDGTIQLPYSKSLSNRALIINELVTNKKPIHHLSDSDDTLNLQQQLQFKTSRLDVGAAGTNMRFLISLLSLKSGVFTLTGSDRICERPVGELVSVLQGLGADIRYLNKEGYPPLQITGGNLQGGSIRIKGNISSQFVSSLLMIAPMLEKGLSIELIPPVVSASYIKMTIGLMQHFGVSVYCNERLIS